MEQFVQKINGGRKGGKMPDPNSKQLLFFTGRGVTEYLENFNFYARQVNLSDEDRLELFPAYCKQSIRTMIKGMKPTGNRSGSWDAFMDSLKEEFYEEDPEQTEEADKRLTKWVDRLSFAQDGLKFRKQRREFERLLDKAGKTKDTTLYTKDLMIALDPYRRSQIFQRMDKTSRNIHTVPYVEMMTQLSNYMREQSMGEEDEKNDEDSDGDEIGDPTEEESEEERKPRKGRKKAAAPKSKAKVSTTTAVDKLADELALLRLQMNEITMKNPPVVSAAPRVPYSQPYQPTSEAYYPTYPTLQNDVFPNNRSAPRGRGRGGMQRGGRYGDERGSGYNQSAYEIKCYYCGQQGHALFACDTFRRDCESGIVHQNQATNTIHFGSSDQMGSPIANGIFRNFKRSGNIRNVVWSILELYPNSYGAEAMRQAIKKTGEKVSTDVQFTVDHYVPSGPVIPVEPINTPQANEVQVVQTNFMEVRENPVVACDEPASEQLLNEVNAQDDDLVSKQELISLLLNGIKRSRVDTLVDQDTTDTAMGPSTSDQNPLADEAPAPANPEVAKTAYTNGGAFASLVQSATRTALDMKVKVSLQQMAQLNPAVARSLADTFADVAESIENTVHVDFSGKVVKETQETGGLPRKKVRIDDGTFDQLPQAIPVYEQGVSFPMNDLVSALGQLRVVVGNTMGGGLPLAAIIDSGSAANTISEAYAFKAGLAIAPTKAYSRSVHGTEERFRGVVQTNVWIGGHALTMRMYVCATPRGGQDRPLFGMPFFHATRFTFAYGDRGELYGKMVIGRTRIVMPMIADQSILPNELLEDPTKE